MNLPEIASDLADELRRHPCRNWHSDKDIDKCARCGPLRKLDLFLAQKAIVQREREHFNCDSCTCSPPLKGERDE